MKVPDGGIMGVLSTSEDKPLKTAGFDMYHKEFDGAGKYGRTLPVEYALNERTRAVLMP